MILGGVAVCLLLTAYRAVIFAIAQLSCDTKHVCDTQTDGNAVAYPRVKVAPGSVRFSWCNANEALDAMTSNAAAPPPPTLLLLLLKAATQ